MEAIELALTYVPRDEDQEGVLDSLDNCFDEVNPEQLDIDNDGYGDACDICDNVNVYTFKHSVGAVGMFWRFLSIDMVDETIIADIDLDNINIHKEMMKHNFNCRYVYKCSKCG